MIVEIRPELFDEKRDQIKSNEFDTHLIKVKAVFQGYKTRKFFNLLKNKASIKDLNIFTNFPLFKSIFASQCSQKILDYLETAGMFFKSSDLSDKSFEFACLNDFSQLYNGELDQNGDPHQFGISISNNFVYEGSWEQGKFHGKGRIIDDDTGIYNGDWNFGARHGNGEMIDWKNNKYTGSWENNQKSGFGIWDDADRHYEGNFSNDMKNGYGEQKYLDNSFYQGFFVDGKFEGKGKFICKNFVYEGDFKNGDANGKGVKKYDSLAYSGDWIDGKRSGFGTYENSEGKFEGKWENDKPIGEAIFINLQGLVKTGKWWKFTYLSYIDEILPNLYLGMADAAANESLLNQLGIKCIVRVLDNENVALLSDFIYYYLKAKDKEDENIISRVDDALDFIKDCHEENEKVLVHCHKGVSRSATVVIAFMMKMQHMNFEDAYKFVQTKRPCINPNKSFIEQLKQFSM